MYKLFFSSILLIISSYLHAEVDLFEIEEQLYFYPEQGEKSLNNYISTQNNPEDEERVNRIKFLKGILAYKKNKNDSALFYLEHAVLYYSKENNILFQNKCQLILGWIAEKHGFWNHALIEYYKVINSNRKDNYREIGLAYLGVERCKMYLEEKTNGELEIGTQFLYKTENELYIIYAKYINAILTRNSNSYDQLTKLANRYIQLGIKANACSIFKSLALKYKKNRDYNSSHTYINKALKLTNNQYPATSLTPSLYHIKGSLLMNEGKNKEARKIFNKCILISDSLNQTNSKYHALLSLSKLDTIANNYYSAFQNLLEANKYERNNYTIKEKYISKLLEISMNLESLKNENKKLKMKRIQLILAIILISTTLILIIILLYIKSQKNIQEEKDTIRYLHKLLINLGEKEALLKNVSEDVYESINKEIITSYDCFETAYSSTITSFKIAYQDLTKSELRYAVMFALGLSDNIIANIRNVDPESIKKTKQRLRKKLGLANGHDLVAYFRSQKSVNTPLINNN